MDLYCLAMSPTKGSSGFGSVRRLLIESRTRLLYAACTFAYSQSRTPVVFQYVQAYCPARINVRMINRSLEGDLRRLERVLSSEVNIHVEHATRVWTVRLEVWAEVYRTEDLGDPMELVSILSRSGGAAGWWIFLNVLQFLPILYPPYLHQSFGDIHPSISFIFN